MSTHTTVPATCSNLKSLDSDSDQTRYSPPESSPIQLGQGAEQVGLPNVFKTPERPPPVADETTPTRKRTVSHCSSTRKVQLIDPIIGQASTSVGEILQGVLTPSKSRSKTAAKARKSAAQVPVTEPPATATNAQVPVTEAQVQQSAQVTAPPVAPVQVTMNPAPAALPAQIVTGMNVQPLVLPQAAVRPIQVPSGHQHATPLRGT